MTTKTNVREGDTLRQEESTTETEPPSGSSRRMPVPSGLSALIQAATSQLSLLAEEPSELREGSGRVVTITHSEDTASSDGEQQIDAPAQTPTVVPEPDLRKQSFPELLMTLALDPSNVDVISFLPDGKFFAIRTKEFSEQLMIAYFVVATFVEFLDLSQDWGFTRVLKDDHCSGIEVFRHPSFTEGEWEKCSQMKFGESPTDARLSALPERTRLDYSLPDDSSNKRRLSPGFLSRRESETSVSSQKLKLYSFDDEFGPARRHSFADSETAASVPPVSYTNVSRTDDLRSIALSITTEKLQIKNNIQQGARQTPLIQRAVESATHTIVTDAIETLLRDESHTKETYLKHEKELSRSSLPGVIPLSTQLFSPNGGREPKESPTQVVSSTITPSREDKMSVQAEKKVRVAATPGHQLQL
jgi:hypothetical protein